MDAASILTYLKPRMKEAVRHDSRYRKAMKKGNPAKENAELQELKLILQKVKDWLETVLGSSKEEVCKLLEEKSTGGPFLPLASGEPEHPEVIMALQLFTDSQLSHFLSESCVDKYKKLRGSVKNLNAI